MKSIIVFYLATFFGVASAQNVQRIEHYQVPQHYVATESLRFNCERAQVGRGLGQCTERTIVQVFNAPQNLKSAQYECSVTWELEKDKQQVDFIDINTKVSVNLNNGNGRASFDVSKYLGNASDPTHRIRRSSVRCFSLTY